MKGDLVGWLLRRPDHPRQGFSLVEAIVALCIFSFLGAIVFRVVSRLQTSAQPTISDRLTINLDAVRAADKVVEHLRESLEVVRPLLGETAPYLVTKNMVNEVNLLSLEVDEPGTVTAQKPVYKLVSYTKPGPASTTGPKEEVLFGAVRRVAFTCVSPNRLQINLTLANRKGEFQFVTEVGLLNFGGLK